MLGGGLVGRLVGRASGRLGSADFYDGLLILTLVLALQILHAVLAIELPTHVLVGVREVVELLVQLRAITSTYGNVLRLQHTRMLFHRVQLCRQLLLLP